jgi:hypothetical protein
MRLQRLRAPAPPMGSASARPSARQIDAHRIPVARETRIRAPAALAVIPSSSAATNRPCRSFE